MRIETTDINETNDEKLAYRGNISKFPIICGLIICVFILMIFSNVHDIKKTRAEIEEQEATIADFKNQEKEEEEKEKTITDIEVTEQKDPAIIRRKTDDGIADQMFNVLLNWRTLEEYNNVRAVMISNYGLTEESPLLQQMLPAIPEDKFDNENMRFSVAKTYELKNDGSGTIDYFALCRVSTNISGDMSRGIVGVFYTINSDGGFNDIMAYPISNH